MLNDLNAVLIQTDYDEGQKQADYFVSDGDVTAYFKNLKHHLIGHIVRSPVIVGCVAWLTDPEILRALQHRIVSIVVQKEDFLRSDQDGVPKKSQLRHLYDSLGTPLHSVYGKNRQDGGLGLGWMRGYSTETGLLTSLNANGDWPLDPIRCVGNHNKGTQSNPRSHHKFVVFCRTEQRIDRGGYEYKHLIPTAVWTGSFNFSKTASLSFENAIYTTRSKIAQAYLNEWEQVVALSEQLDWTSEWVAPEFRIGT